MIKNKLYIDIDGVVGDLVSSIFAVVPSAKVRNPFTYSLSSMFYSLPEDIVLDPQLYSPENFRLYPFVGSVLQRLDSLGFEIMFISSRPTRVRDETVDTILSLGISSYVQIIVGVQPSSDKLSIIRKDIALNNITNAWFIDDNPEIIISSAGQNFVYPTLKDILKTFMFAQTYNQDEQPLCQMLPEFTLVMNWKHIESEILHESN